LVPHFEHRQPALYRVAEMTYNETPPQSPGRRCRGG
jgi:hypothetical protein